MKIIGLILLFLTAGFVFTLILIESDYWRYYLAAIISVLTLDFWCRAPRGN